MSVIWQARVHLDTQIRMNQPKLHKKWVIAVLVDNSTNTVEMSRPLKTRKERIKEGRLRQGKNYKPIFAIAAITASNDSTVCTYLRYQSPNMDFTFTVIIIGLWPLLIFATYNATTKNLFCGCAFASWGCCWTPTARENSFLKCKMYGFTVLCSGS